MEEPIMPQRSPLVNCEYPSLTRKSPHQRGMQTVTAWTKRDSASCKLVQHSAREV
jgi:hypothetical protein